jgi:hypothetical protein
VSARQRAAPPVLLINRAAVAEPVIVTVCVIAA